jgi:CDP-diacylglycerol--serine O-phosphatidyltransferase
MFAVLPTLLTLGNAVCGFGAITFAAKVGLANPIGWGKTDGDFLFIAGGLIFLAMVFDALDGRAARWAKQSSQFGAELDSLCDAVSFGAAPAVILIRFCTGQSALPARLLWMIAVLYLVCAVLRLARFNVETDEEDSHEAFSGLPSPAAAGLIASFMIAYPELENLSRIDSTASAITTWDRAVQQVALVMLPLVRNGLPLLALAVALLMVSRVRYPHVFNQLFKGRRSYRHVLLILGSLAAVFMVRELALPLVFCWFAFGAPTAAGWRRLFGGPDVEPPPQNRDDSSRSSDDSSREPQSTEPRLVMHDGTSSRVERVSQASTRGVVPCTHNADAP